MQIYADVTGREIRVVGSQQAGALGSAMFGAVAAGSRAGGYDTIVEAARQMARLRRETYRPIPAHQRVYEELYADYVQLYDYFGRGTNDVMKRLKKVRRRSTTGDSELS
jgi:L-ribulokinase